MRAAVSFLVVAVTVVFQVTVVDRIAFPGGAGPDLVLLVVAALALAGGPMAGVLTGFLAGLALDVAPPGSHFIGQNALVFCVVGYACGLLADDSGDAEQGHTALFEIVVTAGGAVLGEVLAALLGLMLSDPRVTWPAISRVLPVAVAYDVLLCPFVLYGVAAALRLAGVDDEERRAGWTPSQVRTPAPVASQVPIRQLAGGNGPRLRLSEPDKSPGSLSGSRGRGAGRPATRREPQLKLGRPTQRTSAAAGLGAAFAAGGLGAGASKVRFGGRRREGVLGGSLLGRASPAGSALRRSVLGGSTLRRSAGGSALGGSTLRRSAGGSALGGSTLRRSAGGSALRRSALAGSALRRSAGGSTLRRSALGGSTLRRSAQRGPTLGGSRFGRSNLGRSLLGGSVFSRPSSPRNRPGLSGRSAVFGRAGPLGRSSPFRHRATLMRSPVGGLAGTSPRLAQRSPLARLTGAPRRSIGPKSPGRGWLAGASSLGRPVRHGPVRHASLGGRAMRRGAFGRRKPGRSFPGWVRAGTPRLSGRSKARLRMPRPKAKRRWRRSRTGGYR